MLENIFVSSDEQQLNRSWINQVEREFDEKEQELIKKLEGLRTLKKVFEVNKKDYGWYSAMEMSRKIKRDY
jgi:hypothetical protein